MAAGPSSSQQPSDPWDLPNPPSSSRHRAPVVAQSVPDDWDNDDDEEPQTEVDNQRIWEDANAKAPNPMPTLILSPSATTPHPIAAPPLGAFQPTMRILKRPTSNSNSGSNPTTPPPSSTSADNLKEREARYQAARERIFGAGNGTISPGRDANASSQSLSSKDKREKERRVPTPHNTLGAAVVRNPRGPAGGNTDDAIPKGFGGTRSPPSAREDSAIGPG